MNNALLVGIGLIWGAQFLLNKLALDSLSPLEIAAGRILIGLVTLSLLHAALSAWRPTPTETASGPQPWGRYAVIAALECVLPLWLIPFGQQYISSSLAALLFATVPFSTLLLATTVTRAEKWNLWSFAGVFFGFCGIALLVWPDLSGQPAAGELEPATSSFHLVGIAAIMGAALCYAISTVIIQTLPRRSPVLIMRNVFFLASVPVVILALIFEPLELSSIQPSSWLALFALGIFCSGLTYVMFNLLIIRAGATFASCNNYLVILTGVVLGTLLLGEHLHPLDYIAMAIIFCALALSQFASTTHQAR